MVPGICPKENAFASLLWINGKDFTFRDPNGNYLDEYYYDEDLHEAHHYNMVNNPAIGYTESSEQLVKSTRNALGQVVAQTVNRRLNKFDNLYWPYMSRVNLTELKKEIAKFYCNLTYFDTEANAFITRQYYWGDFSATPCEWERVRIEGERDSHGNPIYYKRPIWYKDVKCNLIDMGYPNNYQYTPPSTSSGGTSSSGSGTSSSGSGTSSGGGGSGASGSGEGGGGFR